MIGSTTGASPNTAVGNGAGCGIGCLNWLFLE